MDSNVVRVNILGQEYVMKTGANPHKITTQLLEQIEFQASRGLSQQQICHALGIS